MDVVEIKYFVESALLAAGRPLSIDQIKDLFDENSAPEKSELREAINSLNAEYSARGIEIGEVASGFRMQVKASMADRLQKLWEDKPPRYSRALFETLALIAYRQPMTRAEIEEVRGVAVSSNIVRTLIEREWIRVVGHRDVPGRPALFGTTRLFLDYFGLKKLEDLPPLADLADWESLRVQLNLPEVEDNAVAVEGADVTDILDRLAGENEDPAESVETTEYSDIQNDIDDSPVSSANAVSAHDTADDDAEEASDVDSPIDDDGFEEIVANEWPDPATADLDSKISLTNDDDSELSPDDDIDASASRG